MDLICILSCYPPWALASKITYLGLILHFLNFATLMFWTCTGEHQNTKTLFRILIFCISVGFYLDDIWLLGGVYPRKSPLESCVQEAFWIVPGSRSCKAPWDLAYPGWANTAVTGQDFIRVHIPPCIWNAEDFYEQNELSILLCTSSLIWDPDSQMTSSGKLWNLWHSFIWLNPNEGITIPILHFLKMKLCLILLLWEHIIAIFDQQDMGIMKQLCTNNIWEPSLFSPIVTCHE